MVVLLRSQAKSVVFGRAGASRPARCVVCVGWVLVVVLGAASASHAQTPASTQPARLASAGGLSQVDLPPEIELKLLADLIAKRLGFNIIYDEKINGQRVTIRSPGPVADEALVAMLQSALQMKGLALTDTGQPGWKRIAPIQGLAGMAVTMDSPTAKDPSADSQAPITQMFQLKHADAGRVVDVIRPFLSQPGGNIVGVGNSGLLIVSDFGPGIARVATIVAWMDQAASETDVSFVKLERADAQAALPLVQSYLVGRDRAHGGSGDSVFVAADPRSNQIVVAGKRGVAAEAAEFLKQIDQPDNAVLRVYRFQSVSPEQVDQMFKTVLGQASSKQLYRAGVDRNSGTLAVLAPVEIQEQLAALTKELDVPAQQSPVRFYKLKNTIAADVLETIAGLDESSSETGGLGAATTGGTTGQGSAVATPSPAVVPGKNGMTAQGTGAGAPSGAGAAVAPSAAPSGSPPANGNATSVAQGTVGQRDGNINYMGNPSGPGGGEAGQAPSQRIRSVRTRSATVTADANTNTIIVMAPPAVQKVYEELITRLDQRRAQVLVECTILSLDTTGEYRFGVEVAGRGTFGNDGRILGFSSFGLSKVARDGSLNPVAAGAPLTGGNFAVLSPGEADIVIKALQTNTRGRLMSVPQLLVNDNETGHMQSKLKVFFAQVNQYNTGGLATTVGGDVDAGTEIKVTPHISEDDYLQMAYSLELSRFADAQTVAGLPPSIQTNNVDSAVTIPDGYTIVVGGLTVQDSTKVKQSVPILGDIPIVEYLFSSRASANRDATLFVFIRPTILRDDKFRDLRYISGQKLDEADIPGTWPTSGPVIMW